MSLLQPALKVSQFEAKPLTWWRARKAQIDMTPPYQRRGRLWSQTDKAYLVDSILNGFDVPKLYLADFTFADSTLNVNRLPYAIIDGKQRFEAIFDFFEGSVVLNPDFIMIEQPELLLGGLGYRDISNQYPHISEIFDTYTLTIMRVVTKQEELINQLFVRLNRSKPLTGAEVRNAMSGPAPEVIRQTAKHEFFTDLVGFQVQRGQDLNAASKVLLFEFWEKPRDTKKSTLDAFVEDAAMDRKQLELAARRSHEILDTMTTIFLPKDRLLASAGVVPIYYWFIRDTPEDERSKIREFLVRFENARRVNRSRSDIGEFDLDNDLVDYDNYNRSTNDINSHVGRLGILRDKFKKYIAASNVQPAFLF